MDLKLANILIPLHGVCLSIIDYNTSVRVRQGYDRLVVNTAPRLS